MGKHPLFSVQSIYHLAVCKEIQWISSICETSQSFSWRKHEVVIWFLLFSISSHFKLIFWTVKCSVNIYTQSNEQFSPPLDSLSFNTWVSQAALVEHRGGIKEANGIFDLSTGVGSRDRGEGDREKGRGSTRKTAQ